MSLQLDLMVRVSAPEGAAVGDGSKVRTTGGAYPLNSSGRRIGLLDERDRNHNRGGCDFSLCCRASRLRCARFVLRGHTCFLTARGYSREIGRIGLLGCGRLRLRGEHRLFGVLCETTGLFLWIDE